MFWLWLMLGLFAALVMILFGGGALLPRTHVATSTITLRAKPADVWAAITDWRALPTWRKELAKVEELPSEDGWIETSKFGAMPLRVEQLEPLRLLVTRIADDRLPFGGTWTWRLEPTGDGGTRLSTTEDGIIGPPPLRLLARFVFGHHKMLNTIHRALAAKFGETATPTNS